MIAALAVVAALLGSILWGSPRDPDRLFQGTAVLGSGLLWLSFALSVAGWGRILARSLGLRQRALEVLLAGSAGAALAGFLLAWSGAAGPAFRWLWLTLIAMGWIGLRGLKVALPKLGHERDLTIFWAVATVAILSRVLRASLIYAHSDPFIYHLLGPRLWWQQGNMAFSDGLQAAYDASFWDALYLWGCSIFYGPGGGGLIEGQLFGQWTHAAFGFGGTALALERLLEPVLGRSRWLPICVLAGLGSYSLAGFSLVAKNDWGVCFWLGGAFALLLSSRSLSKRELIFCGALLGLGFFSKITAVFGLVAIAVALTLAEARARELLWIGVSAVVAASPVLLRNSIATGNPVFPWLNDLFHSPKIGPSVASLAEVAVPRFSVSSAHVWAKFSRLAVESPLARAAPLWAVTAVLRPAWRRYWPVFAGLIVSDAVVLMWPVQGGFQIRWIGLPLTLAGATGGLAVCGLLMSAVEWVQDKGHRSVATIAQVALGSALVLWLGVTVFERRGWDLLLGGAPANVQILSSRNGFIAGDAKAWLRKNARPGDLIVSTADNQLYYVSHLALTNLDSDVDLDREAFNVSSPERIVEILRERGGTLLLDTLHWSYLMGVGLRYWDHYSHDLAPAIWAHPETIVFMGDLAIIVDIVALDDALHGRCTRTSDLL